MTHSQPTKRSIRPLLYLTAIFAGPIVLAWVLYQHPNFVKGKNSANGKLIHPPTEVTDLNLSDSHGHPLSIKNFQGHWTLLFNDKEHCDAYCQQMLFNMHQIQIATGKDRLRIQLALATTKQSLNTKLLTAINTKFNGTEIIIKATNTETFAHKNFPMQPNNLYIIDPMGLVMMRYNKSIQPMAIFNDVQRLLMASQIG